MPIKVGCCGWRFYKGGLKAYVQKFMLVEVQQTFYKPPMVKTAERWRAGAPGAFEFVVKAFQAITHLPTSPTWRRSGIQITETQRSKYGWLRPTHENFEAWNRTKEICDALNAKICLIQCPPNFKCSGENINNLRKFFGKIDKDGLTIAWEPRGDWKEHPSEVKEVCSEFGLIHVVDLMRCHPLSEHPIAYVRLHGLNPREYDYNYKYSSTELKQLAKKAKALSKKHREIYLLFNNFFMYDNAAELMKILEK
jgi:uncharacterized protein YecE (DUF72 family)